MSFPDMRENVKAIIYGDIDKPGEGEWVVYRHFHRGELTNNWANRADEAIGGEKLRYSEKLIKIFLRPLSRFGQTTKLTTDIGNFDDGIYVAMMEHDISKGYIKPYFKPIINDVIFTILNGDSNKMPSGQIKYLERFQITSVEKSNDVDSRPSGWLIILKKVSTK